MRIKRDKIEVLLAHFLLYVEDPGIDLKGAPGRFAWFLAMLKSSAIKTLSRRARIFAVDFHLCKKLRADKIEIRIGVDCFCYSPACAGVHLDSLRPSFVGLPSYTQGPSRYTRV